MGDSEDRDAVTTARQLIELSDAELEHVPGLTRQTLRALLRRERRAIDLAEAVDAFARALQASGGTKRLPTRTHSSMEAMLNLALALVRGAMKPIRRVTH